MAGRKTGIPVAEAAETLNADGAGVVTPAGLDISLGPAAEDGIAFI